MISGNNNPAMNALMQKVMTDKDYAKRFNKMSDAEKEAEVKKFMAENSQDRTVILTRPNPTNNMKS